MEVKNLVCLGDSITWGFPFGPEYSWVNISHKVLGLKMINRGVNGDTAEDLVSRFNTDVIGQDPSHVLIMVGTNDASIGVALQKFSESISTMYETALTNGISTILAVPVPSLDRWLEYTLEKYRFWLRDFTTARNIPMLDFSTQMKLDDRSVNPKLFSDEVHPSKAGYQAMADGFIIFFKSSPLFGQPSD